MRVTIGLRLRLILVLMIPPILAVGVYGLLRVRAERAELLDEYRGTLAVTAQAAGIAVENALRDRQLSDIRRLLAELVEQQDQIDRIRIFDRSLRPILVSNALAIGDGATEAALGRVVETGRAEGFYRLRGKHPVLYHVVPLRGAGGQVDGALEIVQLASRVEARVQAATRDVWLRLAVLLVVGAVLTGVVLQRQVLRPLFRLLAAIRGLGEGHPGPPLPVERPDELGRVASAFNTMAAQLEEARRRLVAESERTLDLEQQLRQAETLAVAGKLASGIAHEIGTPLNIVSGRAELMLHTLPAGDRRREEMEVIIGQIDRITGILQSLLDVVRPRKPDIQPTTLGPVLDRLLPLLRHAARRHGVALGADLAADLPAVLADPNQLQQVLINLLMNAVEATPQGGTVRLAARPGAEGTRAGVEIRVTDDGPGIPPDVLPRVFEPFFTTKPSGKGTGLGLAICRDIVREHAGEIAIESEPGHGSTVRVWLPRPAEAEA